MQLDSNINLGELINMDNNSGNSPMMNPEMVQPTPVEPLVQATTSRPISPLEQAMLNPAQKGAVVTKKEIEEGSHKAPLTSPMSNERAEDLKKKFNEYDVNLEKRKYLVGKKPLQTEEDYIKAIDELESLNIEDPNHVFFDFKKDISVTNANGEEEFRTISDPDRVPEYFAIKTESPEEVKTEASETAPSESTDDLAEESNENQKKKALVQVIIDKTGLGADIHFTEEERKKISESEEIRVKEIRDVNLSSITVKKVTESFQEHVRNQEFSNSRIMICFPASGFSAHMNGLTYGELGDASLSMEGITTAQYNKRLSIIYNKMTNISTGPFENFEDFLKHFAFTDIYMALYGLLVSTFPETSAIQLHCGNDACDKNYEWRYSTRSLLDLDSCDEVFLSKMRELVSASPADYDTISKNAAVNNCKRIELPKSKIIFEMGILSAYEYLYNFIPILNDENFRKEFGERINSAFIGDFTLLSVIRKVYVPDSDGTYVVYDNYRDIMDVFFSINPEESILIRSIMIKMVGAYQPYFFIKDTECPHCHTKTDRINVSMDEILFQTLQRLASTTVDVSNMLTL